MIGILKKLAEKPIKKVTEAAGTFVLGYIFRAAGYHRPDGRDLDVKVILPPLEDILASTPPDDNNYNNKRRPRRPIWVILGWIAKSLLRRGNRQLPAGNDENGPTSHAIMGTEDDQNSIFSLIKNNLNTSNGLFLGAIGSIILAWKLFTKKEKKTSFTQEELDSITLNIAKKLQDAITSEEGKARVVKAPSFLDNLPIADPNFRG